MFCISCGQPIQENDRFCPYCGAPQAEPPKPGRRWPAVLALTLIFALGLGVYLFFSLGLNTVTDPESPWFSMQDGTLYFDPSVYTGDGVLTIPETICGQTVTALGDKCFYDCDTLIAIHLPATLTHIGEEAFAYCDNLRGVELPEGLICLSDGAFYQCWSLESVCIPASLQERGNNIFVGCSSLHYIFYSGDLNSWKALYFYSVPSGTVLSCTDGMYQLG